jgi:hypothetical protein
MYHSLPRLHNNLPDETQLPNGQKFELLSLALLGVPSMAEKFMEVSFVPGKKAFFNQKSSRKNLTFFQHFVFREIKQYLSFESCYLKPNNVSRVKISK